MNVGRSARLVRALAAVLLALAMLAAATGCTRADGAPTSRRIGTGPATTTTASLTDPTTSPAPTRPQRVTVIGDSLVVQAADALRFAASPNVLDLQAKNGTTVADWTPYVPAIVERSRPDVLIVALGTNDNLKGEAATPVGPGGTEVSYRTRIEDLLRATVDVPCVVWIEPSGHGITTSYRLNAFANNRVLSAVLAEHGVAAASWDVKQTEGGGFRNGWNTIDSIHLTNFGRTIYARLILDAQADFCPPEQPDQPVRQSQ